MPPVSVVMISNNAERRLAQALSSCVDFDEVVLIDLGSTDKSRAIAGRFANVRWIERGFAGVGRHFQEATALARNSWILWLDSDEEILPEMRRALADLKPERGRVYSFRRLNLFAGQPVRVCGWDDDRVLRLFHREDTGFSDDRAHVYIRPDKVSEVATAFAFNHYSYDTVDDFMRKARWFSDQFAAQYAGRRRASAWTAALHGLVAFLKFYLLKGGWRGGHIGFLISVGHGYGTLFKYLKLREANRRLNGQG